MMKNNIDFLKYYKEYKMTFDYHTHTVFSHGKGTIEENVVEGIKKGLKGIAISDHGPGHLTYGVKRKDFPIMRKEINILRNKYPEIEIYLSLEANIIKKGRHIDVTKGEEKYFDFLIAGYHYGITKGNCIPNWIEGKLGTKSIFGKSLLVQNTEMVVKALYENNIKILTHPCDKGRFSIEEISKACEANGTLMEISTWHKNLTVEEIEISKKYDVSYVISSDAHTVNRVGSYRGGLKRALLAGLDLDRIVNIEKVDN